VVSLIEAEEKVDTGKIWHQVEVPIPKDFLWNEINEKLFDAEISLIDFAIREYQTVIPRKQDEAIEPTYYEKRGPSDSEIDPELSLASQFDQIRICDPNRFPAFFMLHGKKYKIILEKIHD
jgi:methionyl-tRNA formyltransferase